MKIDTQTVIRTVLLVLALINQILAIAGKDRLPIYDDEVTQLISLSMTVLSSLWAWWKNNSFTQDARAADEYLKQIRTQRIQAKKRKG